MVILSKAVPFSPYVVRILALAVLGVSCLKLVEGSGSRKFVGNERLVLGTEKNLSASLRIGDLDGDLDNDIVVANGRHWPAAKLYLLQSRDALALI